MLQGYSDQECITIVYVIMQIEEFDGAKPLFEASKIDLNVNFMELKN